MKNKSLLFVILFVVVPLSTAFSEQTLTYDETDNTVVISYDSLNRITQKNSSTDNINYSYDSQVQGLLDSIAFGNSTYAYRYDDKYRVIVERRIIDGTIFSKLYYYDSSDRLVKEVFASGEELDYYYDSQGKLTKIKGFVNNTKYTAFGMPLNRTYANSKSTTYTYFADNARLNQIKTDSTQDLNYTYDNVGNIKEIQDSANNRSYRMSYDHLDRLTNVSINEYKWVYSFDSLGNILKIVRNFSTTTSFKMDGSLAHAPQKVIVTPSGTDVYKDLTLNTSNKTKIVEFYLINEKNGSLTNGSWMASFGDSTQILSNISFNLSQNENLFVVIEHNYSRGGNYLVNLSGRTGTTLNDYEYFNMLFGALAQGISILKQNATNIVTEFTAYNSINQLSQNWGWQCNNGVVSNVSFNMSANENIFIVMEHNFSLSNGSLVCSVNSSDGNQSLTMPLSYSGIAITNYNSTKTDADSVLVKFGVTNYFTTQNINWNITTDGKVYRSTSPITLQQGESTWISQEVNYSGSGLKEIRLSTGSGNFSDTYAEYYYVDWLEIGQFYATIKNATARIFDFIIYNENDLNTTTKWNSSVPILENTTWLDGEESLIVVIEEDFGQGNKQVNIKVFNGTLQDDRLLDIFKIRQIEISQFQTMHQEPSRTVVASTIKNNINPLNISWSLDNSQSLITPNQTIELNTSEQVIVVVESSFNSEGIYPLTFGINSSSYNDNATGVAIS